MIVLKYKKLLRFFLGSIVVLQAAGVSAQQPLTLTESRQLALKNNNRIHKADEDINAAHSERQIAGVAAKPKLDASATAFYFGNPINKMLPEYGFAPILSVTQPIYTGGKIKTGKELAENGVAIGAAQKKIVEDEVLLATETVYWQVALAKEEIKLEQQVKKQLASQYNYLNNQFQAGLTYKNDVFRAKVQQNENESRLQLAENRLVLAKKRLGQLIGIESYTEIDIIDSLDVDYVFESLETEKSGVERPEVELASTALKRAELTRKMLQGDLKPTVGLALNGIGAIGKKGINFGSSNHMLSYFGMLSINMPLFDWGSKKEKVRQQESFIRSAKFGLEELKSQIDVEKEQAVLDLQLQAKNIELMKASLIQADENLRLSNDRFKAGTITGEDVLIAETLWQKAYSNMLDAKIKYKIAEAIYRKVIGQIR